MMYVGFALNAGRVEMILADDDIEQVREDLQDWADTHFPDYTWIAATEEFTNCRRPSEIEESIKRVRQYQDFDLAAKALPILEQELADLCGKRVDEHGNLVDIEIAA